VIDRIGRYQIVGVLGRGGQGLVYEGLLRGAGRFEKRVAIKQLHSGAGLQREARLGGLLRHPNLVDVYEYGEDDGRWFCAMELCPDGAIAARLPLSPRAVVEVGLQVAAALQYAHEELGLVHLDLKPENLLLDGAVVKVADLGIARGEGFAEAGPVRGTPAYMAPEQLEGAAVDARTDIYALGVVLAELASGQRAGAATTFSTQALPAPAVQPPTTAPWLAATVARCTAPDPADRFASMSDLAAALRALPVEGPGLAAVMGDRPRPSLPTADTNLGSDSDVFVGRDAELRAIAAELDDPGLVTLKGPGGIGKTHLARVAARAWCDQTGAQAWFCDLSEARGTLGLLQAVAAALGIALGKGQDQAHARQVGWAIASRGAVLLVLDNFEHLLDQASLLEQWRLSCPEARFLATSRAPLKVARERVVEVAPLAEADAVSLLATRAMLRGAEVSGDPALHALARRLDGVPLALELAAGRIGLLSPSEVLERLGLRLLRSAARTCRIGRPPCRALSTGAGSCSTPTTARRWPISRCFAAVSRPRPPMRWWGSTGWPHCATGPSSSRAKAGSPSSPPCRNTRRRGSASEATPARSRRDTARGSHATAQPPRWTACSPMAGSAGGTRSRWISTTCSWPANAGSPTRTRRSRPPPSTPPGPCCNCAGRSSSGPG
jgi:hypothetical protein